MISDSDFHRLRSAVFVLGDYLECQSSKNETFQILRYTICFFLFCSFVVSQFKHYLNVLY